MKHMFGILYETEDGKIFHPCRTLEEAQHEAGTLACMGYTVTVFDYDIATGNYLEFYTV